MTLIHGSMERDTAAQTGMELVDRDVHYNRYTLMEKHGGDRLAAQVDFFQQVIRDQQLQGRLGIYGQDDPGATFTLLNKLQSELTDTELVGEFGQSIFTIARQTKDNAELAELQEAGRLTCQVV
ncbi:MAG: hypothetical protein KDE50_21630, partial [Caldilineaceae bacterium]|nr:hypothetical protein [Caldilineaceae bacterium]